METTPETLLAEAAYSHFYEHNFESFDPFVERWCEKYGISIKEFPISRITEVTHAYVRWAVKHFEPTQLRLVE